MSREWKPGDVAMVPGIGRGIYSETGQWVTAGGSSANFMDVRPLVVIDPEDRAAVERFRDHVWDAYAEQTNGGIVTDSLQGKMIAGNAMQAALRSLVTSSKPNEPTGSAALVEDVDGDWWVRLSRGADGAVWHRIGVPDRRANWSQITAVKVLSEGVTP